MRILFCFLAAALSVAATPEQLRMDVNTAVLPAEKLENDGYDWYQRHAAVLAVRDQINPEIVLIGDSITHFWGGEPKSICRGPKSFAETFAGLRVLNLGFGWDRTQNVLWRLIHGGFAGLKPRWVVLHVGTNNTSGTGNARANTPDEIAAGIKAICLKIQELSPDTRILLMAVFPREEKPEAARRKTIAEINRRICVLHDGKRIFYADIGPKMLQPDGTLSRDIMNDFCHPTEKGYEIWGAEINRYIR